MTNKKLKPTATEVAQELLHIISGEEKVRWAQIVTDISAKYVIRNWLTQVRGPLQFLMNEKLIERISDDRTDEWYRIRR